MVTIVDPSGTPIPVYNRSGATVVEVASGPVGSPTEIPHASQLTIALVTSTPELDLYVQLPDNAEIGDVVEIYRATSAGVLVVPSSGADIDFATVGNVQLDRGTRFRKVRSDNWSTVA